MLLHQLDFIGVEILAELVVVECLVWLEFQGFFPVTQCIFEISDFAGKECQVLVYHCDVGIILMDVEKDGVSIIGTVSLTQEFSVENLAKNTMWEFVDVDAIGLIDFLESELDLLIQFFVGNPDSMRCMRVFSASTIA